MKWEDTNTNKNVVPVTKPQENRGKCGTKRSQRKSRKLSTQILRPGLREMSFGTKLESSRLPSTISKVFSTYYVPDTAT